MVHLSLSVGKYKCECCEVTFSCYRSFQQHIKSAYHLQKVAECGDGVALLYSCLAENCKMSFTRYYSVFLEFCIIVRIPIMLSVSLLIPQFELQLCLGVTV